MPNSLLFIFDYKINNNIPRIKIILFFLILADGLSDINAYPDDIEELPEQLENEESVDADFARQGFVDVDNDDDVIDDDFIYRQRINNPVEQSGKLGIKYSRLFFVEIIK